MQAFVQQLGESIARKQVADAGFAFDEIAASHTILDSLHHSSFCFFLRLFFSLLLLCYYLWLLSWRSNEKQTKHIKQKWKYWHFETDRIEFHMLHKFDSIKMKLCENFKNRGQQRYENYEFTSKITWSLKKTSKWYKFPELYIIALGDHVREVLGAFDWAISCIPIAILAQLCWWTSYKLYTSLG